MHRISRRSSNLIIEACHHLRRNNLNTSSVVCSKWNPVVHERYFDLGRHVYEAFTVGALIDQHPELNAAEIHDFTQGLTKSDILLKKVRLLDEYEAIDDVKDFFAKLGELRLKDKNDELNQLLSEVSNLCISQTSKHEKQTLIKCQHPKFILKEICSRKDRGIVGVLINNVTTGSHEAVLVYNNEHLTKVTAETPEEAERLACLQALNGTFAKEFEAFSLDNSVVIPSEELINLEIKSRKQRQVNLTKSAEEPFGFTIRGGERKAIRNKEYIQLHITTPVFISLVEPGSPADRCNLQVGDVLLGVNDHSLDSSTHRQAVTSLKKFLNSEEVVFTVKHSMKEVRKYEAEKRYLEREKDRIRDELSSDTYKKWHDAKAKQDPEQYLLEQLKDKKRPFKPKKHRQSLRLWDY